MRVSRTAMLTAVDPNVRQILERLMVGTARAAIAAVTALTNNSTGVAGASLTAVNTPSNFSYAGGATIASRAAFNTATTKADDAIAVLAKHLSDNGTAKTELGTITANTTGVVAVAGTVPALDKVVTGTDGAANAGLGRIEAAAIITALRNNLATVARAYNSLAVAVGVPTVRDDTGGKPTINVYTLVDIVDAATGVGSSGDAASKADIDAALTSIANDIATLATKINTSLFAAATLTGKATITLQP